MDSKEGITSTYKTIILEISGAVDGIATNNVGGGFFSWLSNCLDPGVMILTYVHGSKIQ
jgi:hypothetical protein